MNHGNRRAVLAGLATLLAASPLPRRGSRRVMPR